jgi:hypothetical protein
MAKDLEDYLAEAIKKGIDVGRVGEALAKLGLDRKVAKKVWVDYTVKTAGTDRKSTEGAVEDLLREQYDPVAKKEE